MTPNSHQLWTLFVEEGASTTRQLLDLLASQAAPAAGHDAVRSWHLAAGLLEALCAQSMLMGVEEIGALCREAGLLALRAVSTPADSIHIAGKLHHHLQPLDSTFQQLQLPDASGAHLDPVPLLQALEALRLDAPTAPAPTPPTADQTPGIWVPLVDEDMVDPFIEECTERLASLATHLVQLESTSDPQLVRTIFRDLHTLKGSSGFVGLPQMNRLAHAAEDLVGEIRDGTRAPGRGVTDALLAALDGLRALLDRAADRRPIDVAVDPLVAGLRDPTAASTPAPAAAPPTLVDRAPGRPGGLTLRVDFDKLDLLLNLVGELVLDKARIHEVLTSLQQMSHELSSRRRHSDAFSVERRRQQPSSGAGGMEQRVESMGHDLDAATSRLDAVTSELRDQVMTLRMVPIAGLLNKYRRVARDLAHSLDREVELTIHGADTELDKLLVEQLDDPLLHLVRNAVDHGIEPGAQREAAGKPARGQLLLSASHQGHQIVIEVSDDGAGIDPRQVGQKAVQRGLVTPEELARMDHHQLLELIFLPGLSTADSVTGVSGRGVGMDVVRQAIVDLRGSIDIDSTVGQGTRFLLRLPLTLAISNVLLCRAGGQVLAVPIHAVKHTLVADPNQTREVAAYPTLRLDEEIPLIDVAATLGLPLSHAAPPFPVALVDSLGATFGLVFDQLIGRREIVIKSLGNLLERVPCCAGATLLGDRCALILDVPALVRRALESPTGLDAAPSHDPAGLTTILVVEDSDTAREDLRRVLSTAGYRVQEARDGEEALQLARQRAFQLVSTDVMMPGMDGYELCRRLRQLPSYGDVPIVMLTGRDQEIDRIRGFDAGVDAYLVKPVDRGEMTALVQRLLHTTSTTRDGR